MAATSSEILYLRTRVKVLESGLDLLIEEVAPSVYVVPSQSQAGISYLVVRRNGILVCECEGARHGNEHCAHVVAVEVAQERKQRSPSPTPPKPKRVPQRREVLLT